MFQMITKEEEVDPDHIPEAEGRDPGHDQDEDHDPNQGQKGQDQDLEDQSQGLRQWFECMCLSKNKIELLFLIMSLIILDAC